MNYFQELNAFDTWLETNPVRAEAIALWFALIRIANNAGWPEEFTVANGTLQTKAGLSIDQLKSARDLLVSRGLIGYVKSKKVNQAGKYKMLSIAQNTQQKPQRTTQQEPQQEPQRTTQQEPQRMPHINKLNITKQTERENAPALEPVSDLVAAVSTFYVDHELTPAMNEFVADEIRQLCAGYPGDWIRGALVEAGKNGARSLKYFYPMLNDWVSKGFAPWERKEKTKHASSEFVRNTDPGTDQGGKKEPASRIQIPDEWVPPVYSGS